MSSTRKQTVFANRSIKLAVAAALAGLWMGSASNEALGQYRIEDGRARDASNRVGDYGRNDLRTDYRRDYRANANQIVTGNVAGLYGFRGNVNYRETTEFRGNVATSVSDSFIRRSSGGYTGYGGGVTGGNYPTAFYTRSRTVQPPANYVREGYGLGAYVPAPTATAGDRTVEYGSFNRGFYDRVDNLPPPNNLILPAPTGSETGSYISATPLTGIQQYQQSGLRTSDSFLSGTSAPPPRSTGASRLDADVERMRNELRNAASVPGADGADDGRSGANQTGQPIGTPLGSPMGEARDGAASMGQNTRYRFTLPPEQQSAQYAEMRKRLEEFNANQNVSDEQAYRAFQDAQKARTADPNATQGREPNKLLQTEPVIPAPGAQPESGTDGAAKPGETTRRPLPIKVDSLAAGVSGKGLSEILTEAEQQMKEGKFASAIDKYEVAEQVAPNNPLIALGRANAELGAGFYARAEAHLRQAFSADKALLVGQYNLKNFLGEERLQVLVKDLKEIANREKQEPRPVFLLAYVAYNTGNERMAAGYLDLAEKRAGKKDPLYDLIRQHWNLPQVEPIEGLEEPATKPAADAPNK